MRKIMRHYAVSFLPPKLDLCPLSPVVATHDTPLHQVHHCSRLLRAKHRFHEREDALRHRRRRLEGKRDPGSLRLRWKLRRAPPPPPEHARGECLDVFPVERTAVYCCAVRCTLREEARSQVLERRELTEFAHEVVIE